MMRKIVSLLSVALFILALPIQVVAVDEQYKPEISETMPGYLVDDSGNITEAVGQLVSTVSPLSVNDETEATYEFNLYSVLRDGSYTLTSDETDGSGSVTVYLTVKYSTRNTPTEYKLTNVSGNWQIHDGLVSVTSNSLTYGFAGNFPSVADGTWTGSVSNPFNKSTGFTDYIIDSGAMGAHLTLNLKMGSSRIWDFTVYNYVFGQH